MTTIEDVLTYIDGSNANGRLVVAWKPFTVGNVNAAGGELEWPIVDGEVSISLYANTGAQPTGSYYVAKYELENGAVYLEQWVVPNLPTVNLGQVRVSFPPSPSVMISPLQLTSLNAQPGMFLQWDGQRWVPAYPSTFNLDPNWIAITTDSSGNDVGVIGSPVHLGNSVTIHIPDAGLTSRGVVTTSPQSFGGVKTFANTVNISTSIKFALRSVAPVYGELLGFGTGGADTSLSFGGNIIASRVSPVDRPYVRADNFIGSGMDLATFGIAPTAVMPGTLANPARTLAAFLLPVAGTVDWTGIGTDTAGALWLRTGTSTSAGFLYLDTAGNVTAREFRMDPYQHLNAPGVEAVRSDATMVMYSGTTDWAGYGVNSTPEIWFRMGPNAAGAYYYFGAGGARFPGNLTVGNIVVTGGVTLPVGTYVPTSRRIDTSTGLIGGGDLTVNRTLSVVDDTTTQRVEAALAGNLVSARHRLNFIAGTDQSINVVDDAVNNRVNITFTTTGSGGGVANSVYAVNGTVIGTRSQLNLISGTNVTLVGADNSGAGRVDITVSIVGGGGALIDPTTTKGDIIARGAAAPATRLGVGTDAQVLTADSTQPLGLKWTAQVGAVPPTRLIIAGTGLGGGGSLAADVTLTANVVSVNGQTGAVVLTAANVGGVPTTRQVIAGTGLTGGGPLSSDVTLAVVNDTVTERVRVSNAGTLVGTRQQINFIQGSNITLTVADVPGSNWVGVTVAATTSGMTDPTTTKGDLIARPVGPPATRLGVGATDGMVLTVDSTDATFGIKWKAVPVTPPTPLTPWTSDIDGAGFTLRNVGKIGVGNDATTPVVATGYSFLMLGQQTAGAIGCGIFTACSNQSASGLSVGTYAFANYAITGADKRIAQITANTDGAIDSGVIAFNTSLAGATAERMRITATGAVGIGTTNPLYPLDLKVAGAAAQVRFYGQGGVASNNCQVRFAGQKDGELWALATDTSNAGTKDFHFYDLTSSAVRMTLQAGTGNCGIGATPVAALHVSSFVTPGGPAISGSTDSAIEMRIRSINAGTVLDIGTDANGSAWIQNRANANLASQFSLLLNPNGGNVGVGFPSSGTSPLAPLHVARDAVRQLYLSGMTTPTNQLRLGFDTGNNTGVIELYSGGAPGYLVLQPTNSTYSNLGIGTTNPQAKVDIYGHSSAPSTSGPAGLIRMEGDAGGNVLDLGLYPTPPYGPWLQGTDRNSPAVTYPIVLQPLGNSVGVGVVNPGYKLDVAGDVNCSAWFRINGSAINYSQYAGGSGGTYDLGVQADIPGLTLTVPYGGRYLIMATINMLGDGAVANTGRIYLIVNGVQQPVTCDYGPGSSTGSQGTVSLSMHLITAGGSVVKVQAAKLGGVSVKVIPTTSNLLTIFISAS